MFLHSFRSSALLAVLLVGAATLPSSLRAQQIAAADLGKSAAQTATVAAPAPVSTATPAPAAGPRRAPAWIITSQPSPLDLSQPQGGRGVGAGSDIAMMGTGAAAVVVGLLVGGETGTIISFTGGVVGLVGLFRYLR
jgi:hypothetical protein